MLERKLVQPFKQTGEDDGVSGRNQSMHIADKAVSVKIHPGRHEQSYILACKSLSSSPYTIA
jgi:hypothetical protein